MKRYLNLGCGQISKIKSAEEEYLDGDYEKYYCDIVPREVENFTQWNLNYYPYPFKEDYFDLIICRDCFEHLVLHDKDGERWIDFFKNIHRILKKKGIIKMRFPHFSGTDTVQHHSRFSFGEWQSIFNDEDVWWRDISPFGFEIVENKIILQRLWRFLSILINLNRRTIEFWEKYLCYIIRGQDIYIELRKK